MLKEFTSGSSFVTAAKVYEKTKGPKEALKIAEEGYNLNRSGREIKNIYARLLVENDRVNEGMELIDKIIEEGKPSEELLKSHKSAYIKIKGSDNGYDKYLDEIINKHLKNLVEEIKSSMIEKTAPEFTIKDLDGHNISLSDFKGKIVILDFWATWCGPCKASFPLMKKSQEKYADNTNLKFLFINTMERTPKVKENVEKFIKSNNYPFHVLLDNDSKVSGDYGVSAIPTKIFIDKQGNIRYISLGFDQSKING